MKLRQRTLNAHLGSVNICTITFFVCGSKYTNFFSSNMGVVVDDKLLFLFSICWSGLDIFAVKVESCQKSSKILDDFFALPNFWGWAFQKLFARYYACLVARRWKKFREDTTTSTEDIDSSMLNFRPNFKYSRLNFWGDPHPIWDVRLQALVNL